MEKKSFSFDLKQDMIKKKKDKFSLHLQLGVAAQTPQISKLCSSLLYFLQLSPPTKAETIRNMVCSEVS